MVEVADGHVRDVGARGHRPPAHAVRVLAGVFLDRPRGAAVGVPFAQNGVHRAAQALGVAAAGFLLRIGLRIVGEVRQRVALVLQFLDRGLELRDLAADVRQLDDVGVGQLGEPAQFGQVVRDPLRLGQVFGELRENACGNRDVARLDVNTRRPGEGPNHGKEGVGRQQRRLVGQRVDDGRLLSAHRCLPASTIQMLVA